ncbi:MAG: hypothetical protein GY751_00200 [Bacteroidetes bacterium]|nr:hypothetical protein [Bacteroidota bacterium]
MPFSANVALISEDIDSNLLDLLTRQLSIQLPLQLTGQSQQKLTDRISGYELLLCLPSLYEVMTLVADNNDIRFCFDYDGYRDNVIKIISGIRDCCKYIVDRSMQSLVNREQPDNVCELVVSYCLEKDDDFEILCDIVFYLLDNEHNNQAVYLLSPFFKYDSFMREFVLYMILNNNEDAMCTLVAAGYRGRSLILIEQYASDAESIPLTLIFMNLQ